LTLELVLDARARAWRPGPEWRRRARRLVACAGPRDGVLEVVLTTDGRLRALNHAYRGKDAATDVLSFSYLSGHERRRAALLAGRARARAFCDPKPAAMSPVLVGQVLISLDTVRRRNPGTPDSEEDLLLMVAHGLLHVLGFDHRENREAARMEARQRALLARVPRPARRTRKAVS
jgi:probable rRNA maturation factor